MTVRLHGLKRIAVPLLGAILSLGLLAGSFAGSPLAARAAGARYYPATGYSVGGAFLRYFDTRGGLRVFGYPLSSEMKENGLTVQYFERERFEYHPEFAGGPNEVQLGLLGFELGRGQVSLAGVPAPSTGLTYFYETRHTLSGAFLRFWRANGGVAVLGYPISEPVRRNTLTIQYFQRARMEYHPEKASSGFGVELGLLGREYIVAHPSVAQSIAMSTSSVKGSSQVSASGPAAGEASAAASRPLNEFDYQLIWLINNARKEAGLAPVALDNALNGVAFYRANDMATKGYFAHETSDGTDFVSLLTSRNVPFNIAGEIMARNNYPDDRSSGQAYLGFMNSPHHKEIVLDGRYNFAGLGSVKDGDSNRLFAVIFSQR